MTTKGADPSIPVAVGASCKITAPAPDISGQLVAPSESDIVGSKSTHASKESKSKSTSIAKTTENDSVSSEQSEPSSNRITNFPGETDSLIADHEIAYLVRATRIGRAYAVPGPHHPPGKGRMFLGQWPEVEAKEELQMAFLVLRTHNFGQLFVIERDATPKLIAILNFVNEFVGIDRQTKDAKPIVFEGMAGTIAGPDNETLPVNEYRGMLFLNGESEPRIDGANTRAVGTTLDNRMVVHEFYRQAGSVDPVENARQVWDLLKTGDFINHGQITGTFQNGKLRFRFTAVYGKTNGLHEEWWDNGNVKQTGQYVDGNPPGKFPCYDEKGNAKVSDFH